MNKTRRQKLTRSRGFGLVETLVSAALVGTMAVVTATYLGHINDDAQYESARMTQEQLADRLRLAASNPETIFQSVRQAAIGSYRSGNTSLANCLSRTSTCTVTRAADQMGFYLWETDGQSTPQLIAGPEEAPVLYDIKGNRGCTPAKRNCLFKAVAKWWATCPMNDRDCPLADSINVRISIIPNKQLPDGPRLNAFPKSVSDHDYAVSVRGQDINKLSRDSCPDNQKQVGFTAQGRPICKCIMPLPLNAPDPPIPPAVCPALQCDTYVDNRSGTNVTVRKILTGFEVDPVTSAVKLKCLTPDDNEYCWDVRLRTNGDCGLGAWLMRVNYGSCSAIDNKGTGPRKVDCTNDIGTCCRQAM